MPIQFSLVQTDEGNRYVVVFANGRLTPPADDSHPNFKAIVASCQASLAGEDIDEQAVIDLFDVSAVVERKFAQLSDRVAVVNGEILFDGDPVAGELQDQILDFVDSGEDFGPLVKFYEKLATNPLGDVREGLFSWINGQRANGNFTITYDGDILGYKSYLEATPEWRTDVEVCYVPSRRGEGIVNGIEVPDDKFIETVAGDRVEMPRSKVLNRPSAVCGDGLHIGTFQYANTFNGARGRVFLVKFSPRDIVSLPDSNSSWKLRVCRFDVIEEVTEALEVPVYSIPGCEKPAPYCAPSRSDFDYDYDDYDDYDDDYEPAYAGASGSTGDLVW